MYTLTETWERRYAIDVAMCVLATPDIIDLVFMTRGSGRLIFTTLRYSSSTAIFAVSIVVWRTADNIDPDMVDFHSAKKLLKASSGKRFKPPATDVDIAILSEGCVVSLFL